MVMYSLDGARPVPRLPHQFRYQGRLYSDPSQWYPAIGEAAGWAEVEDKPDHDPDTQNPATWNGTAWVVPDKSLAELKTAKAAAAQAKAQALIDAGFIYAIPGESPADERTYSISDTMQAHMMAIYNRIKGGGSGPMAGVWPDASDTDCEFSDAEWTAFAEAASEYKEGILRNLRVFLRNVRASANTTQLDNCVVSTGVTTGFDDDASGWPTNGS